MIHRVLHFLKFYLFVNLCREFLHILGLWSITIPKDLQKALKKFILVNQKYWNGDKSYEPSILIGGHLSQYGPNYAFRSALAAKAIQEKKSLGIEVVCNGFSHQWKQSCQIYSSFKIENFLFLENLFPFHNLFFSLRSTFTTFNNMFQLKTPSDILKIKFNDIYVGDLIYDEILRITNQPTVKKISWPSFKVIKRSWYFYYQYQKLLSPNKYDYYITTHTAYPEYGLLCRVALEKNITVIETSDIQMSTYNTISDTNLPTYHQGINNEINSAINHNDLPVEFWMEKAKKSIYKRLNSENKQINTSLP